ncbi:FHA domain-containing protein [Nocardia sp. NPDC050710]|uniref:FHA domain-containing protein n=1 Tax=Nocardia sp. NPDC050710 TaxID=3157220 RepID=UPI0033DAB1BD
MRKNPSTVGIATGDGLIARFGAVVVYLAGETASTDRILGAIEAVADADHPGAAIAQRLAAVVFGSGSEPPPFGVVAPTSDGTVILLRGPVVAEIQGAEGVRRLSGARAFTWVDEIVREPVRRITVGTDIDAAFTVHPRTDLRSGVVPGGGFELRIGLWRAGRTTESARAESAHPRSALPEPAHTAPAGFDMLDDATERDQPGVERTGRAATHERSGAGPISGKSERAAVEPSGPGRTPAEPDRSAVERSGPGRVPTARPAQPRRIAESGAEPIPRPTGPEQVGTQAMSPAWSQTPGSGSPARPEPVVLHKEVPPDDSKTRPARPSGGDAPRDLSASGPVGALVYDETAYPLDRPYVIGRSPMSDDAVRKATASPLAVPRDRHVSRIHAYVTLDRGKVFVRDAGTPAGTFIAAPGAEQWTRIGTSVAELAPGWSIRIGEKILTYRTEERRPASSKPLQQRP